MHNHHSAPGIRSRFHLILPPGSDPPEEGHEDAAGRRDEERGKRQRVLVAEDEFLLSTVLIADLRTAGYEVLGPYSTLAAAMQAVQSQSFDAAILDINLKNELIYPVAEELARRSVPFLFLSGYALINMPERFRSYPRIAKPADWTILLREVQSMLGPKS